MVDVVALFTSVFQRAITLDGQLATNSAYERYYICSADNSTCWKEQAEAFAKAVFAHRKIASPELKFIAPEDAPPLLLCVVLSTSTGFLIHTNDFSQTVRL